jgi:hypothetical protein
MAAGPDLFVYVELSTLLDLLGAALFLFAFATGVRLLLVKASGVIRRAVGADDVIVLLAGPGPASWRAYWAMELTFRCRVVIAGAVGLLFVIMDVVGRA